MAFDEGLVERIREVLADEPGLIERRIFGSHGFMIDGNLCAAVHGDDLMARVPVAEYEQILTCSGVSVFVKPMKGWVLVSQEIVAEDLDLRIWLDRGLSIARSLLPK